MHNDELVDFITSKRRKSFCRYSGSYYIAHIKRIADYVINRPMCFFNKHKVYDGIFHTRLVEDLFDETETYEDGYKCYHCRYCDKPLDQELHDEKIK